MNKCGVPFGDDLECVCGWECFIPKTQKLVFSKLEFDSAIVIVLAAVDPSFYYGEWVVKIQFTDQSYTFYSCGGFGETFDADGNRIDLTHFSCDREQLEELIKKYCSVE